MQWKWKAWSARESGRALGGRADDDERARTEDAGERRRAGGAAAPTHCTCPTPRCTPRSSQRPGSPGTRCLLERGEKGGGEVARGGRSRVLATIRTNAQRSIMWFRQMAQLSTTMSHDQRATACVCGRAARRRRKGKRKSNQSARVRAFKPRASRAAPRCMLVPTHVPLLHLEALRRARRGGERASAAARARRVHASARERVERAPSTQGRKTHLGA